jgi:hypothetical protein
MEQPQISACSSTVYDLIINQPYFSSLGYIVAPFGAVESVIDDMTCIDQSIN